jgi:hypothetical protein
MYSVEASPRPVRLYDIGILANKGGEGLVWGFEGSFGPSIQWPFPNPDDVGYV